MTTKAMQYEETAVNTKPSKTAINKYKSDQLDKLDTGAIIWHLVKRHKFGLVCTYALVVSVFYFTPFLPDMVLSLVR